jgi:DNA-binding MarR family transcriptional regulator
MRDQRNVTIFSYQRVTNMTDADGGNGSVHQGSAHQPTGWTFLTNHAHVLFCIAHDPEVRLRDVALRVGITERAVQRIVTDLEDEGYLAISKEGRRNRYRVNAGLSLRHIVERHCSVQGLIDMVLGEREASVPLAAVANGGNGAVKEAHG